MVIPSPGSLKMLQDVSIIVGIVVGVLSIITTIVGVSVIFMKGGTKVALLTQAIENLTGVVEKGFSSMSGQIGDLQKNDAHQDIEIARILEKVKLEPSPK